MANTKKLNELYREVFWANYSPRSDSKPHYSSVKDKCNKDIFSKEKNCIVTSALPSDSSLKSHFKKLIGSLNEGLSNRANERAEFVIAVQPHYDVMVAGYVIDNELICKLAGNSLGLGLTIVKPEIENYNSLDEKRKAIFISRKKFDWNNNKYIYCNHAETGNLISINLSFTDNNLKPATITEMMGIEPDKCSTGNWLIACEDYRDEHNTLHDAMNMSLTDLLSYREQIYQITQKFNYESTLSVALNTPFDSTGLAHYRFSTELFKILESFGVNLALSLWLMK